MTTKAGDRAVVANAIFRGLFAFLAAEVAAPLGTFRVGLESGLRDGFRLE